MNFKYYLWNLKFGKGGAYALNLNRLIAASEVLFYDWEHRFSPKGVNLASDCNVLYETKILAEFLKFEKCPVTLKIAFTTVFNNVLNNIDFLFKKNLCQSIDIGYISRILKKEMIVEKSFIITGYMNNPLYITDIAFSLIEMSVQCSTLNVKAKDAIRALYTEIYCSDDTLQIFEKSEEIIDNCALIAVENIMDSFLSNIRYTLNLLENSKFHFNYCITNSDEYYKFSGCSEKHFIYFKDIIRCIDCVDEMEELPSYSDLVLTTKFVNGTTLRDVRLSDLYKRTGGLSDIYSDCKLDQSEAIKLIYQIIKWILKSAGNKRRLVEKFIGNFMFEQFVGYPKCEINRKETL